MDNRNFYFPSSHLVLKMFLIGCYILLTSFYELFTFISSAVLLTQFQSLSLFILCEFVTQLSVTTYGFRVVPI